MVLIVVSSIVGEVPLINEPLVPEEVEAVATVFDVILTVFDIFEKPVICYLPQWDYARGYSIHANNKKHFADDVMYESLLRIVDCTV